MIRDRSASMAPSDEELVRRFVKGDRSAFETLVHRHTRLIYNLAYRFTQDTMEAENIAQETFLRTFAALPTSQIDLPFKPWLIKIAVNLCRNRARRKDSILFSEIEHLADEEPAIELIADEDPLPLEQIEAEEMVEMLRQAIAVLPPAYRLAVTLRYNEGLSYTEISEALGLPLNTVRTHLFRAKLLLRSALAASLGE